MQTWLEADTSHEQILLHDIAANSQLDVRGGLYRYANL